MELDFLSSPLLDEQLKFGDFNEKLYLENLEPMEPINMDSKKNSIEITDNLIFP